MSVSRCPGIATAASHRPRFRLVSGAWPADQAIISLYAKGLTTGDIAAHMEDVTGQRVDRSTISRVTAAIVEDMAAWQSRPLDAVYPVLLVDGIRIKIRDGSVTNRVVYVVMGINLDGDRDILGLWVGPTGGESPKFWLSVMTELKNRGLADVLLVCCDGLKGLPDAARAAWPLVDVQLCVVHLVRNSLRYASKKHCGADHTATQNHLHRSLSRCGRDGVRGVHGRLGGHLSGDDPSLADRVGRLHPVPRVPRRAQKDRIQHQRDRVVERQVPQSRGAPRSFPDRASCVEGAVPDRDREEKEPD